MKISRIFGWICLILWIVMLVVDIVGYVGGAVASWPKTITAHILILFFVARDLAYEYFFYPYMTFTWPFERKEDNE